MPMLLRPDEMRLGDVIQCFNGPFGTGVVVKITDDAVTIHRPYAITSDFSYGSEPSVIPYQGSETLSYWKTDRLKTVVWERKEIK